MKPIRNLAAMKTALLLIISVLSYAPQALAYHQPESGRWLSRDPIGESGGINLYGMVRNDPVNYTDTLGLFERDGKAIKVGKCEITLAFGHGDPNADSSLTWDFERCSAGGSITCYPDLSMPTHQANQLAGQPTHHDIMTSYPPNQRDGDNHLADQSRKRDASSNPDRGNPDMKKRSKNERDMQIGMHNLVRSSFTKAVEICERKDSCCGKVAINTALLDTKRIWPPPLFEHVVDCAGYKKNRIAEHLKFLRSYASWSQAWRD